MAWNFILAYIVVTEVVLFAWIWWSCFTCDESDSLTSKLNLSEVSPIRKFLFYLIMNTLMFIAAPIAVPVMGYFLVKCVREEFAENQKLFRMFKELLLDPLHPSNMPEELGQHIEEHLPAATAMGFESLGDYWLKDEPYNSKGRILLSADQLAFAEIAVSLGTYYCEAISFLEDGSMIGTANVESAGSLSHFEEKGWYANIIGKADMLQTLESHYKFLQEISQRTNQPPRKISRENWKAYYQYHNQKYGQARFELGETDTAPEKCEFPIEPMTTTAEELTTVS